MIAKITTRGFRGPGSTTKLGGLNLFIGPNGSGKSQKLLGVSWLATSKVPHSELAGAVLAFADGNECSVRVILDDGWEGGRFCSRDPVTKAVTSRASVNGQPGLSSRRANEMIDKRIGTFAPMFDLGRLLAKKAEDLREFVVDLCAHAVDGKAIHDAVAEKFPMIDKLVPGLATAPSEQIIAKLVAGMTKAKEETLQLTRDEKLSAAARLELIGRKNEMTVEPALAETLKAELADIASQISSVDEAIGKARGLRQSVTLLTDERAQKNQDRAALLTALEEYSTGGLYREGMVKRRDDAQTVADATLIAPTTNGTDAANAKCRDLVGQGMNLRGEIATVDQDLARLSSWQGQIAHNEAALVPWKELADKLVACPVAAANEGVGRWLLDVMGFVRSQIELIEKRSPESDGSLDPKIKQANANHEALVVELDECDRLSQEAIAQLDTANHAWRGAQSGYTEQVAEQAAARQSLTSIEKEIVDYDAKGPDLERKIRAVEGVLAAIVGKLAVPELKSLTDISALTTKREGHVKRQKELKDPVETRRIWDHVSSELARMAEESQKRLIEQDEAKQRAVQLKAARDIAVAKMMEPVMMRVGEFLGEPVYCTLENDRGKPTFEIGIERAGSRISLDALSGGERARFCIGFAVSLITMADPPEKLLLIDATAVDHRALLDVMALIHEKAKGFQVLLESHIQIDNYHTIPFLPDWKIHDYWEDENAGTHETAAASS